VSLALNSREILERLSVPGPRLPWVCGWLTRDVWTPERFQAEAPVEFLERGEKAVNALEDILTASAARFYDEMGAPSPDRDLSRFLGGEESCAAVVLDGLSLREMPALLALASQSGKEVEQQGVATAALPSETMDFVEQRLGVGHVAPSALGSRAELKTRGIKAYYYAHPGERHPLDADARALLLWSAFPDNTYRDSGARFAAHFAQLQAGLEAVWKATVMAIPPGRRILITSDHGYAYLGSGLCALRTREEVRPLTEYLGGERCARPSVKGPPPVHPDLARYPERDVAVLRGRVPTYPSGPSSNKLYKHGGLSLMEMLTPWVILKAS
jgi:hypothetical protein